MYEIFTCLSIIVLGLLVMKYSIGYYNLKEILDEKDDPRNIFFSDKEKEILIQSVDEHIRLLTNAGMHEQNKEKKAKYLITKNTMLDILKKLKNN